MQGILLCYTMPVCNNHHLVNSYYSTLAEFTFKITGPQNLQHVRLLHSNKMIVKLCRLNCITYIWKWCCCLCWCSWTFSGPALFSYIRKFKYISCLYFFSCRFPNLIHIYRTRIRGASAHAPCNIPVLLFAYSCSIHNHIIIHNITSCESKPPW